MLAALQWSGPGSHAAHQIQIEDFVQKEVTFMDDETGLKEKKLVGGYQLLFWLITGWNEKIAVFEALLQTIGVSRALVNEFVEQEKKTLGQLIGQSSSTDSQANTDGQPNTSGPEL